MRNNMNERYFWRVVPLCERQLRDVNPKDILNNGLYRKCNTYKSGRGYDRFSGIYCKRNNIINKEFNNQFVVQLQGCPLRCPYCCVTPDGAFGKHEAVSTERLVQDFIASGMDVFHLMGGAPALYIEHWLDILKQLPSYKPFHSDLLLQEKYYPIKVLKKLSKYPNGLYAVSIKGANAKEFKKNTGVELKESMFWTNLDNLVACNVPFYLTFTGNINMWEFMGKLYDRYGFDTKIAEDSFVINLVDYKALH